MAKVDINTKMITLLGDPLKQSFAAQIKYDLFLHRGK